MIFFIINKYILFFGWLEGQGVLLFLYWVWLVSGSGLGRDGQGRLNELNIKVENNFNGVFLCDDCGDRCGFGGGMS